MSEALPGLDQLQELPLPAAVPYWPQTWGWAVLAAFVLIGAAWAGHARWRRWRRNRYRRQALAELARLARATAADPLAARALPGLLKRTALAAGQPAVAPLGGQAWLAHLAQDGGRAVFPDDGARMLALLAYAPDAAVRALDAPALARLFAASRRWMESHHVAA